MNSPPINAVTPFYCCAQGRDYDPCRGLLRHGSRAHRQRCMLPRRATNEVRSRIRAPLSSAPSPLSPDVASIEIAAATRHSANDPHAHTRTNSVMPRNLTVAAKSTPPMCGSCDSACPTTHAAPNLVIKPTSNPQVRASLAGQRSLTSSTGAWSTGTARITHSSSAAGRRGQTWRRHHGCSHSHAPPRHSLL